MAWLRRARMRALAALVGVSIAAFGLIAWAALPVLPVVGVAVATVAVMINSVAARLDEAICRDCGHDLMGEAVSDYGVACPRCGLLNPPARNA